MQTIAIGGFVAYNERMVVIVFNIDFLETSATPLMAQDAHAMS